MNAIIQHITCPDYQFESLDLEKVSKCIDNAIISKFANQSVVIRGIQSEKHEFPKEQLIRQIIDTGSDRYAQENKNEIKVNDRPIDLFGYACIAKSPITLSVLEGFHKWKPMCLERPKRKVDIWMLYDANQLENVEYNHSYYNVKARDGYLFKNPDNKSGALLGIIVID
jgi:hypothetical protein